jgi:hypothetical protein
MHILRPFIFYSLYKWGKQDLIVDLKCKAFCKDYKTMLVILADLISNDKM